MNENPWHIDDIARLERERIQEEMREIRMVESVNRSRPPRRRSLLAQLMEQALRAAAAWFRAAMNWGKHSRLQQAERLHAKRSARA